MKQEIAVNGKYELEAGSEYEYVPVTKRHKPNLIPFALGWSLLTIMIIYSSDSFGAFVSAMVVLPLIGWAIAAFAETRSTTKHVLVKKK